MKLYQFRYSPYAAKVRKCLELKRLAYQIVEVPYLDRRELVALTGGYAHVPVLAAGDQVVFDSARITAWLDEKHAPSLRPEGGAAVVFEQWADSVLEDQAFRLAAPVMELQIAEQNGGREDARAMYRLVKERKFGTGCLDAWRADERGLASRVSALLAPLRARPFLLGEEATLADAAVWGNLHMIECVSPGRAAHLAPHLAEWYQRLDGLTR
jgi:glutathione S-transferase